jgi:hypothetical protein
MLGTAERVSDPKSLLRRLGLMISLGFPGTGMPSRALELSLVLHIWKLYTAS